MISIFTLLPIFGFSTLFYIYLKKTVSTSIFFSISTIIVGVFIFGMLGVLQVGSYLFFYGGVALLVAVSWFKQKEMLSFVKSVPFVLFLISSILYLWLMKDSNFFFWDEFSHWGPFAKELYYFNHLYDASAQVPHLRYPPGISVWDYFILSNFFYSEGNIYFAYFLILFSSTLMMYEKLKWSDAHWIFLVFLIQISIFATYGHWFSCIYVDHIVGALFAGLILSYLVDNFSPKELLLFALPIVALVLVKEVGLYFGLSFLGLVWFFEIYKLKVAKNLSLWGSIIDSKKIFMMLLIVLFSGFISLKVWNLRQDSLNVSKESQTISGILSSLTGDKKILDNKTEDEVKKRFWEVVLLQQMHKEKVSLNYNEFSYGTMSKYHKNLKLSTVGTLLFFILLVIASLWLTKDRSTRDKLILLGSYLLMVAIGYLIILYLSYLVAFGSGALRIPSYVRYMNMALLPLLFIAFALFLPIFGKKDRTKSFFVSLGLLVLFIYISNPYLKPLYSQLKNPFVAQLKEPVGQIHEHVPKGRRLLAVFPIKNNGSLNNILKYDLMPIRATVEGITFQNKSFSDMLQEYGQYDYIWFVTLNKTVVNKNRTLLRQKNQKQLYFLYKVEKNNSQISLKPIF